MEKPISMVIEETKKSLADVINNCGLHPSIIEMVVKDIYLEVNRLNMETKKQEKEQFLKGSADK